MGAVYHTNIILKRPISGTKVRKVGKYRYVYRILGTSYQKNRKYNMDDRSVIIGKMIEGSDEFMYPNDKFASYFPELMDSANIHYPEPPAFCDTLKVGTFAVIRNIASERGVTEILNSIYNPEAVVTLLDLICYIETDSSCALQHYPAFMRDHLQLGKTIRSDSFLSRFLRENVTDDNIQLFLHRWNKKHISDDVAYINFDGTNFNWEAILSKKYSEFGKAKDDPNRPQANLMASMDNDTGEPLDYQTYNGSINDMSEINYMIERMHDFGYKNVCGIYERGFFNDYVIKYLDTKNMMLL